MKTAVYACLTHPLTGGLAKLLEKIPRSRMAAIEFQYFFKKAVRLFRTTQSGHSLGAEKERLNSSAPDQIFVEQQHRGQGCGEVINLGRSLLKFDRVIVNASEKIHSIVMPP